MTRLDPHDSDFEGRVRASFARQQVMQTIGATLTLVEPGVVEIDLPYRAELTQQHGFIHAGIVASILDSACGYAAFSLMPADAAVLSIEFKVNLLAPAKGELIRARAEVKRAGKNRDGLYCGCLGGRSGTDQDCGDNAGNDDVYPRA